MPVRSVLALGLAALAGIALDGQGRVAAPAWPAREVGRHVWTADDPRFGGVSGLELADDGETFAAVTDRGMLLTGRLLRDGAGRLSGVDGVRIQPLRDARGAPVTGRDADAEGLAVAPDGTLYVSFEAEHRVWSFAGPGTPARPLPLHPDFARLQNNSGLEALAIDREGRLLTLPERSGRLDRPFPVYRLENGAWTQPFDLPRDGAWLPVGADVGPDGRLYLLERNFRGLRGFDARVSRFALGPGGPGPREVLLESRALFQNNFEGIAVWRDGDGRLRFVLVSDDNFAFPLTTELVEYRLAD
ncbi:MAG: esterase-like activity of phytase family protein [Rhodobacteraceae bacterium]|nr:esterase-like activity of phytase family protein [Paracoccaceae bacterium]